MSVVRKLVVSGRRKLFLSHIHVHGYVVSVSCVHVHLLFPLLFELHTCTVFISISPISCPLSFVLRRNKLSVAFGTI